MEFIDTHAHLDFEYEEGTTPEKIIKEAQNTARNILAKEKKTLEKVAKVLIEKETIEREEFEMIINQKEKPVKKEIQKVSIKTKKES